MAVRAINARTDETGVYTVTNAVALGEVGSVRDTSGVFSPPPHGEQATIMATGNFDTSCTLTLQGSVDAGANWFTLATALTAAAPVQVTAARAPLMRFAVTADGAGDACALFGTYALSRRR